MIDIQSFSSDLQLADDGIWYSDATQIVSYPSTGNDDCFAVEDNSFWFRHRNECITSVVKCFPPENNGAIFDIGGGNGFVSAGLERAGFDVVLMEPGQAGASNAKKRGVKHVICASTDTAKLRRHSLAAVGLFDVVEHTDDDLSFLRSIAALLKKSGRLYVTVPAYSILWSAEDVAAGHFRRYDARSIHKVLTDAGFSIEFSSYIFRPLPVPILLLRTLPFLLGLSKPDSAHMDASRDHAVNGGPVTSLLGSILHREIENLRQKRPMRFGGSCLIVAKAS